MKRAHIFVAGFCLWVAASVQAAPAGGDVALITAVEGAVTRGADKATQPVQAFVKLKEGDLLSLAGNARLQIVFFESRRQESWHGTGKIEIAAAAGRGSALAEPEVKVLPEVLVKQIAKTPALDSQGRAGVVRLRALPMPDALVKLESDYKRLREDAGKDDLNPEIFFLSSLMEMRQLERLEKALSDIEATHAANPGTPALLGLYRTALKQVREGNK